MTFFQSASRSVRQSNIWSACVGLLLATGAVITWSDDIGHLIALNVGVGLAASGLGGLTARHILTKAHEIDRRHR